MAYHILVSSMALLGITASSMRFSFTCTPYPQRNRLHFIFILFLHSSTLSATHHNTSANKWFHYYHRCFPGTLMMTDVSGGGITSRVVDDQRVARCPYSTQGCALTLGDSFFHPFMSCSSLNRCQTHFGLFLVPFANRRKALPGSRR